MQGKDLRIVFMGTPDFAVGILSKLVENQFNVVGVITVADKPAGRGKQLKASPIKQFAEHHKIKVLQPTNLKNEQFLSELSDLNADVQVVVAFRMLPKEVWMMPKMGTFNLHASLLPAYRGAAPINWAIINGEKKTGVTTFFIDDKIDTGAIILQDETAILETENLEILHDKLQAIGANLVVKTLEMIAEGNVKTTKQPETPPSLAPKLNKENTRINWKSKGNEIVNLIRGLDPYPAAWTPYINNGIEQEMKIFKAKFENTSTDAEYLKIHTSKNGIHIPIEDGILFIEELQLPSKKRMDAKSLLNGFKFDENSNVF